jgi:hypothetical protein
MNKGDEDLHKEDPVAGKPGQEEIPESASGGKPGEGSLLPKLSVPLQANLEKFDTAIDRLRKRTIFHKIVNWFLGFFVFISLLFVIFLGFSQTSTFRAFLKDQIVSILNKESKGHFEIGGLDGSFFTTLTIRNVLLTYQGDTVSSVEKIHVRLNLIGMLQKTILVKEVSIVKPYLALEKDSAGVLNIQRVFPSKNDSDTTESSFPFKINVKELGIRDGNIRLYAWTQKDSLYALPYLSMNNLHLDSLQLSLSAVVDIDKKDFHLKLNELSSRLNLQTVPRVKVSGEFIVNRKQIQIGNFVIDAPGTECKLNLATTGLDLFGKITPKEFAATKIKLRLDIPRFNFADLRTFAPAVNMLNGSLSGELLISGPIHKLEIEKLALKYQETSLQLKGFLENIDNPGEMYISADMQKSSLTVHNIEELLPAVTLTQMPGFEVVGIDSLSFRGKPLDFKTSMKLLAGGGVLKGTANLNFTKKEPVYDAAIETRTIDCSGLAHFPVVLNGALKASGTGFNPKQANLTCAFNGDNSTIGKKFFPHLAFDAQIGTGKLAAKLQALSTEDSLYFDGGADFTNDSIVAYQAGISLYNYNFATLLMDTSLASTVNMNLQVDAQGLKPDDIEGKVTVELNNTKMLERSIRRLSGDLVIKRGTGNYRDFELHSDIADAAMKGNFSIPEFFASLADESAQLTALIKNKFNQYMPRFVPRDTVYTLPDAAALKKLDAVRYDVAVSVSVRDTQKVRYLLPHMRFELDGEAQAFLKKNEKTFTIAMTSDIRFLKLEREKDAYFVSDSKGDFSLQRAVGTRNLKDIKIGFSTTASKVLAAQELKDVACKLTLGDGLLGIGGSVNSKDKMKGEFSASMNLLADTLAIKCEKLIAKYNLFEIKAPRPFLLSYANGDFRIHDLELKRGEEKITAEGILSFVRDNNLSIKVQNIKGYDISYSLIGMAPNEVIDNDMNLNLKVTGSWKSPIIALGINVDSVTYKSAYFGSLRGDIKYQDGLLHPNIQFIESAKKAENIRMSLTGSFPINLSFESVPNRFSTTQAADLHFLANNFNLTSLSNFFPWISRLHGVLNGQVDVGGTFPNLEPVGSLRATDVAFRVVQNNLDYSAGALFTMKNDLYAIDSFVVRNTGNVKNKGAITGHGTIVTSTTEGMKINASLKGDLTVLSDESRVSNSSIYGNLFIGTDGDVALTITKDRTFLSVPLLIKESNVIFPSSQSSYSASGDHFVYRVKQEKVKLTAREKEIQRLLALSSGPKQVEEVKTSASGFDYEIKVKIKNEANFTFVFSQEANQKLNAVLKGDLIFERKNGLQNFQGELKVLDGSTLDLFKTFSATGSLRFESDITNPNLNIVGMYKAYKADTSTTGNGKEEEVAIKVKLNGPMRDLAKTFTSDKNNISIYVGANNIDKEIASPELDEADAFLFLTLGKFKRDLSQQERSKAASQIDPITGTATSLAGSLVGGLLNSYFGDYVKSLELRNMGTLTKFNLSGKFKDFRYTFGGSTNFLQDLSTASIRIEYPIFENLLLRLERRESVTETNYQNEMINEFGIRYQIEF